VLGAVLVGAATRCTYPSFTFDGTTSGGGQGGVGTTSSQSSTTHSSSTTTSSTTTSSSGTGGTSTGPKTCHVLQDTQDCGPSGRCTIVDENVGTLSCVPLAAAPLTRYAACPSDQDCPAGTWCDQRTRTCAPFCTKASDCSPGSCVSARNSSQQAIPGLTVCTAHCDPEVATPCGAGATCAYDLMALDFDCFVAGNGGEGASCASASECQIGLVCVGNGTTNYCRLWCHDAGTFGDTCNLSQSCKGFSTPLVYNGVPYGYCN